MLTVRLEKKFKTNGRTSFSVDVSFSLEGGIAVLFGPSGSGKTTILRLIAGVLSPDSGKVELGGRVYFDSAAGVDLPIQERRIGFVFQDYLLFPHLTAYENVGFGIREARAKARRERVAELLDLCGIGAAAERYPRQLSGGEQQRVALARALGSEPAVLLLDEPFAALDAPTRLRLLEEIVNVQRQSKVPFVYVTHSAADAVRAGDCVLILDGGRMIQQGVPAEVFNAPRDLAVSRAVGSENILPGRVAGHEPEAGITWVDLQGCRLAIPLHELAQGTRVMVGIRAEDIIVARERIGQISARNLLEGIVRQVVRHGAEVDLRVHCGVSVKVRVTAQAADALGLQPEVKVYLVIKASSCHVLA
jgi:molybdate transport system ATP-binding protein